MPVNFYFCFLRGASYIAIVQKLIEWNDQLMGAPVGVLIFIACIVLGYVLKIMEFFPNKRIPAAVVVFAVVLFMCAAPERKELAMRIWLVKNFCIGMAIGLLAWLAHAQVLKRIEEKMGWFDDKPPTDGKPLILPKDDGQAKD